jgi:hypothetical protein
VNKKILAVVLVLFGCMAMAFGCQVNERGDKMGAVEGLVTDSMGTPIEGVKISATGVRWASQFTNSDSKGKFVLGDIPIGDQVVFAEKTGYIKRMRAVTIPLGDTVYSVNFIMVREDLYLGQ